MTPQRRAEALKHGPHLARLFDNQAATEDLMEIAGAEVAARQARAISAVLRNDPHAAVIQAAEAEGIQAFHALLKGIAADYRKLATPGA